MLVFPRLFFPASDPASSTLASLATFGIAFLARPIGSALFGHFGDRIGRKKTLVLALSTMSLSTFAIGALPAYHSIGIAAPLLLALCRVWTGHRARRRMGRRSPARRRKRPTRQARSLRHVPATPCAHRLPALSGGTFLLLSRWLTDKQFFTFGWRLPFLASAVLVRYE